MPDRRAPRSISACCRRPRSRSEGARLLALRAIVNPAAIAGGIADAVGILAAAGDRRHRRHRAGRNRVRLGRRHDSYRERCEREDQCHSHAYDLARGGGSRKRKLSSRLPASEISRSDFQVLELCTALNSFRPDEPLTCGNRAVTLRASLASYFKQKADSFVSIAPFPLHP